jgi:hypothetical protein
MRQSAVNKHNLTAITSFPLFFVKEILRAAAAQCGGGAPPLRRVFAVGPAACEGFPGVVTYSLHEKHVDVLTRSVAFKIGVKTVSKVFEKM